jgi:hypothetical protein
VNNQTLNSVGGYYKDDEAEMKKDEMGGVFRTRETEDFGRKS